MMPAYITRLIYFAQHGVPREYAASDMMRADLEALCSAKFSVPEGYKLVPVEPTPEMVGAMATTYATGKIREGRAEHSTLGMMGALDAYAAMLEAAPQPGGEKP